MITPSPASGSRSSGWRLRGVGVLVPDAGEYLGGIALVLACALAGTCASLLARQLAAQTARRGSAGRRAVCGERCFHKWCDCIVASAITRSACCRCFRELRQSTTACPRRAHLNSPARSSVQPHRRAASRTAAAQRSRTADFQPDPYPAFKEYIERAISSTPVVPLAGSACHSHSSGSLHSGKGLILVRDVSRQCSPRQCARISLQTASHELRSPLTVVTDTLRLCQHDMLDETSRAPCSRWQRQTQR